MLFEKLRRRGFLEEGLGEPTALYMATRGRACSIVPDRARHPFPSLPHSTALPGCTTMSTAMSVRPLFVAAAGEFGLHCAQLDEGSLPFLESDRTPQGKNKSIRGAVAFLSLPLVQKNRSGQFGFRP